MRYGASPVAHAPHCHTLAIFAISSQSVQHLDMNSRFDEAASQHFNTGISNPEETFLQYILTNPVNAILLQRLPSLALPDWYLVSGCLFQSVWNGLTGKEPTTGIADYDIFYYNADDTSWQAEDAVIQQCAAAFADIDAEIQVRNQARVHLWYGEKFGIDIPQLKSSRDAIDAFLNQSSCFGIRSSGDDSTEVYAPFGYDDLFAMILRPNPRRKVPDVYYQKAARWCEIWPELTVIPWPQDERQL